MKFKPVSSLYYLLKIENLKLRNLLKKKNAEIQELLVRNVSNVKQLSDSEGKKLKTESNMNQKNQKDESNKNQKNQKNEYPDIVKEALLNSQLYTFNSTFPVKSLPKTTLCLQLVPSDEELQKILNSVSISNKSEEYFLSSSSHIKHDLSELITKYYQIQNKEEQNKILQKFTTSWKTLYSKYVTSDYIKTLINETHNLFSLVPTDKMTV